jgi:DNA-binding NtrC family response regulator
VIGRENAAGVLGDSIVVVLLRVDSTPKELEASVSSLLASLHKLVPVKQHVLYKPENPAGNPREWLQHIRQTLNPSELLADEIQDLTGCDVSLRDAKQILEKHIIMRTLRQVRGNITRAAELLGVHRPQLSQLIRKHELRKDAFAKEA